MEDIVAEPEARDGEESSRPKTVCGRESEEEKDEKENEEKKGGIMTHLISNLISPLSPKAGQVSAQTDEVDKNGISGSKSEEDVGSHAGKLNNFISNWFQNHSEYGKQGDEQKKKVDEHEGEVKEEQEPESGVVGLIDNIVSHFPTTIPDDAVPTTDEASILIHSIIKD